MSEHEWASLLQLAASVLGPRDPSHEEMMELLRDSEDDPDEDDDNEEVEGLIQ